VLQLSSVLSHNISGSLQEELPQGLSRLVAERCRIERCGHMLEPSAPLDGTNSETRVRFPQAQPPSMLSLLFIATQELNEESGELFGSAAETLTREKRTEQWVLADTRVELCRQPSAARFTAKRC
jgi:hypothetical protein